MAGFPAPQPGVLYLTEGGQETELMYRHGHDLPEFAMYPLLDDPRAVVLGSEPVRVGAEVVGRVTSGGFGYTCEQSLAYAYVPVDLAKPGTEASVNLFGSWVGATVTDVRTLLT